ncbi:TPA: hypothetical protein HA278_00160 [Candidatus Woesearchaeota archaeon]|nr:hypothetical protein [Candidatus Woesearchaeota archaeon]
MWVAKFKIKHDCWMTPKTATYKVSLFGLPLGKWEKNGKKYHSGVDILQGSEEEKQQLLKAVQKEPSVVKYEYKNNQLFVVIEGEDYIAQHWDPALFMVSPVLTKGGYEYWELGSWDRARLVAFYEGIQTIGEVDMLKLKKEVPSLFIHQAMPKLTVKQKEAFLFAKEQGYYSYPRTVSVAELARKVGVARSTFQNHLRKAEAKIMNVVGNGIGL